MQRPERFKGIVAQVPFVDVVTTMLDESIPLTTGEFEEWGNPQDETYYRYMKEYSPYDNVEAKAYPHLLVTTGCMIRRCNTGSRQNGSRNCAS
jgi:oligopeptidase B